MTKINIDLTAIKNSGKHRQAKNGHYYIDLIIADRKEPDRDGNTLSVSVSKSKEERESKVPTIYVGAGKTFGNAAPVQQANTEASENTNTDGGELPF